MSSNQTEGFHLFTLRLWSVEDEDGHTHWRGKLHHINRDEIRYFQDWSALIPVLLAMLRSPQSQPVNKEETSFPSTTD